MRKFSIMLFALPVCVSMSAQSINQSVQVSNEYETEIADFRKSELDMFVPDSLLRFDYDFDYSVFETPYKGAYEFSPYSVRIVPEAAASEVKKFYLRAGVGFSLHPELDFVFAPVVKEKFSLSLFNEGRGYYGRMYDYAGQQPAGEFNGYDVHDNFGIEGHAVFPGSLLTFRTGWDGILSRDMTVNGFYNSAFAHADLCSNVNNPSYFFYDFDFDFRFGNDSMSNGRNNTENLFGIKATIGPVLQRKFRLLVDLNLDSSSIKSNWTDGSGGTVSIASAIPHLEFVFGALKLSAGANIGYRIAGRNNRLTFSPVVDARMGLLDGKINFDLGVKGGQKLNSYFSLKNENHFYNGIYSGMSASWETFNAYAGLTGSIGSHFSYALKGGYAAVEDHPLQKYGSILFADVKKAYAQAELSWKAERLDILAAVVYDGSRITDETIAAYAPSLVSGNFSANYNWGRRIYAGVWVEAATARSANGHADLYRIPGFVNLGLNCEVKVGKALGVWVQGGNLTGMRLERIPGFARKGPYVSLGVTVTR